MLTTLDVRSLLDNQVKMLSGKLDIKVWKEVWDRDKYLGVDSMWIAFTGIPKGVNADEETLEKKRLERGGGIHKGT